jgi:hypothetical protein
MDKLKKRDENQMVEMGEAFDANLEIEPLYESLKHHLDQAYWQAATGKGKDRHANNGQSFEHQDICEINRRIGSFDGCLYQACKKSIESKRILQQKGKEAAIQELYGAINYLAAACIIIDEMPDDGEHSKQ